MDDKKQEKGQEEEEEEEEEEEDGEEDYQRILTTLKSSFLEKWKKKVKDNGTWEDFERFRTLGVGAFGRVILAKHRKGHTYHAIKILEKSKVVKLKQVEHTYNEKRVLQSIEHPFVVYMEYYFKDNSYIYMVLPYVNGGDLFTHLKRLKRFDEELSRFYASQVVLALEYMHHCNVIYRDLKPENILVEETGYIKLTDLGFCKMIEGRTWTLCGTPEYLAPEIILSKGYGKSVDWWSFGVLVYEMNSGYPPFYAHDPMKLYEKIVAGKYKTPSHFNSGLNDLLRNLLQVDSTRRYGNLKNGVTDIKKSGWFQKTNWMQIYKRKYQPSFKPKCSDPGDDSNFDRYEEQKLVIDTVDRYAKEFIHF